jgi:mono/diheme cytochrome c family protein
VSKGEGGKGERARRKAESGKRKAESRQIINHPSSIIDPVGSDRPLAMAAIASCSPVSIRLLVRAVLVCTLPVVVGCSASEPLPFRLNTEGRDPSQIAPAQKEALVETLTRLFGTPDEPKVPDGVDLQPELLRTAAGPIGRDAEGRRRGLYRQYCAACHGISGDGAGPTAALLDPYPRDFRTGVFKYTSTAHGAKPVWEDLDQALRRGNPGTAMPSFEMLPADDIKALVEYVKYLSIRGETGLYLLRLVVDEDEYLPLDMQSVMEEGVLWTAGLWKEARRMVVVPPDPPTGTRPPEDAHRQLAASIAAGREIFLSERAKCFQCHGLEGKGDGEQSELYDDWNTAKINKDPAWFQLPIQRLRPRDFTREAFRGGDRPVDLYLRVSTGINGTPMPAAGPHPQAGTPGSPGALTPEEIWHVVDYVRSLGRDRPVVGRSAR